MALRLLVLTCISLTRSRIVCSIECLRAMTMSLCLVPVSNVDDIASSAEFRSPAFFPMSSLHLSGISQGPIIAVQWDMVVRWFFYHLKHTVDSVQLMQQHMQCLMMPILLGSSWDLISKQHGISSSICLSFKRSTACCGFSWFLGKELKIQG